MERGNGNEVVDQDRGSHCAISDADNRWAKAWLDFAAKEMHAHIVVHRTCFLGAKMEVQENLIRGTTWK